VAGSVLRLVIAEAGVAAAARQLFGGHDPALVARVDLSPKAPFAGPLFSLLAELTAGDVVGLVAPGVWRGPAAAGGTAARDITSSFAPLALAVRDHVNLVLRGPLTGRWPAGVPRSFPCMTGIYQPGAVRAAAGAPVYSEDVVVAGVGDGEELTPFERRALDEAGAVAYADRLVPAVIAAAFYGLKVAACVVTQAAHERE
jgi:hypothetical protein